MRAIAIKTSTLSRKQWQQAVSMGENAGYTWHSCETKYKPKAYMGDVLMFRATDKTMIFCFSKLVDKLDFESEKHVLASFLNN